MEKNVETARDAAKILEQLGKIQAEQKLNEEIPLSPVQIKLNEIRLRPDGRVLAGKRRAAKNKSRRLKKLRDRSYDSRRRLRAWERAAEGNWWPRLVRTWGKRQLKVKITEKQWKEHIAHHLPVGALIVVHRYDTKGAIALDNIYITESGTSSVLWDGKEFKLKSIGAIL